METKGNTTARDALYMHRDICLQCHNNFVISNFCEYGQRLFDNWFNEVYDTTQPTPLEIPIQILSPKTKKIKTKLVVVTKG